MNRALAHVSRSHLSHRQKAMLRLAYDGVSKPRDLAPHLNSLQYTREVLRRPEISYVPPAFVVTITDQCNLRCPELLLRHFGKLPPLPAALPRRGLRRVRRPRPHVELATACRGRTRRDDAVGPP